MNDGDHMHGMASAAAAAPPPAMMPHRHMMMHMTFFWGKNTEILFHGWPGYDHLGNYVLALVLVFVLALITEWLSHCNIIRRHSPVAAAARTAMYTIRIGLAYMVMLAVMSFNAGVFLAAVGGHGVGFFVFGIRAFKEKMASESDLPPMNC